MPALREQAGAVGAQCDQRTAGLEPAGDLCAKASPERPVVRERPSHGECDGHIVECGLGFQKRVRSRSITVARFGVAKTCAGQNMSRNDKKCQAWSAVAGHSFIDRGAKACSALSQTRAQGTWLATIALAFLARYDTTHPNATNHCHGPPPHPQGAWAVCAETQWAVPIGQLRAAP